MSVHQLTLFTESADPGDSNALGREIPGLGYIADFITEDQEDVLLRQIDAEPWMRDLKRRVQHYGFKYSYKARKIDRSMRLGPLPHWANELGHTMISRHLMDALPDQVIVNEYMPGQGIANHVDCVPCFADAIASLSLGSPCVMEFTNKLSAQVIPVLLEPRSVVFMKGAARFEWMHGIPARKSDNFNERVVIRRRRVSLTFRKVLLVADAKASCPT